MRNPWRLLLILAGVLALAIILPACSDDDPTDPGDGGGPDTDAPTVAGISPSNGSTNVSDSESVVITFNEPMDADSDDGAVTLSHGTITTQTWTDDRNLTVAHTDWPEGTRVEVTVGTGFADVAGNNLAAALTVGFWTESSILAFLDSDPASGATNVNRNASVMLLFSQDMNESSLLSGVTIADDTKANYPFSVDEGEEGQYTLNPDDTFVENTIITVTIGTGVQSQQGENLAEEVAFSFTTGADVDTTPPTIVGFDPPSGSTMSPDQGSLRVIFSEAMDTGTFSPSRMNAQLLLTLEAGGGAEPLWNAAGTEVTVPLPTGITAGLFLEIGFAGFSDANGVVQPGETIWSSRVAGTGDPFPVADGQHFILEGSLAGGSIGDPDPEWSGEETQYLGYGARATAGQWNLEDYTGPDFATFEEYDIIGVGSGGVSWLGFAEDDGGMGFDEYLFTAPLVSAEAPLVVGNTWNSAASVTFPEGTADATLAGEVISYGDLVIGEFDGFLIYWSDAWEVETELEASAEGDVFTREERTAWYVPGIGLVREVLYEERLDPEDDPGWEESDLWLLLEED